MPAREAAVLGAAAGGGKAQTIWKQANWREGIPLKCQWHCASTNLVPSVHSLLQQSIHSIWQLLQIRLVLSTTRGRVVDVHLDAACLKIFNVSPNKMAKKIALVKASFGRIRHNGGKWCQHGFSTLYSAFAFLGRTTKGRRTAGWSPEEDNGGGAKKSGKNDKNGNILENVTAGD